MEPEVNILPACTRFKNLLFRATDRRCVGLRPQQSHLCFSEGAGPQHAAADDCRAASM